MRTLDTKNFFVPGYKAWGIACGIKKNEKKDLAIIYSDREASVAGVFTKNRVKAAPVLLDMAKVKSGKGQAIIVNSGCANACTGKRGLADARATAEAAARELGLKPDAVLVASTGVIGEFLPMTKVGTGIATAVGLLTGNGLGAGRGGHHDHRYLPEAFHRAGGDSAARRSRLPALPRVRA